MPKWTIFLISSKVSNSQSKEFVLITEIFWRIFWLDNWQSLIVFLENFHYSEINLYLDLTGRNGPETPINLVAFKSSTLIPKLNLKLHSCVESKVGDWHKTKNWMKRILRNLECVHRHSIFIMTVNPKLYIPSTLNIDLILWHTQLIV